MKSVIIYLAFFILVILISQTSFSQLVKFNKVKPIEDEVSGIISGITQDPQGYMWLTTSGSGLVKYDGYQVTTYKNDPRNKNTVGSNRLECLLPDANGDLWVGTFGAGLDRFNHVTGNFTHFRHDPKNIMSLSSDTVFVITKDHEGVLWIGTAIGLDKFDPVRGTFIHFTHKDNEPFSLSNNQVRAIYEDKQGTLWIGTGSPFPGETPEDEGGLNRFDRKTSRFIRYMHDPNNPYSLVNNKVRAIFEDSRGTFWVGTAGDGLHTMDRAKGTFQRYPYDSLYPHKLSRPPLNKKISYDHIAFITEDAVGAIWIGTVASGINHYDPKTQNVTHYGGNDSASGLMNNGSWVTYTSRDKVLWISSFGPGIYTIDVLHTNIPHFNVGREVFAFYEDKDQGIWLGTSNGFIRKDKRDGRIDSFVNNTHNPVNFSNYTTFTIAKGLDDNLWLGTFGAGFSSFDPQTNTFTAHRHNPANTTSLINDSVYVIYADKEQNLWIGTMNGLDKMNPATGKFTHFFFGGNYNTGDNAIPSILEDNNGLFWVGTANGLNQLDKRTGKFKRYLEGSQIYRIFQSSTGDLWVTTDHGLYKFDAASNIFEVVTNPSTGKTFPKTISITEDLDKNIWVSTQIGIIKYNDKQKEASTYGVNVGVNGSSLTIFSAFKDRQGQLYFGDATGYFAFYPQELVKYSRGPEVLLSEFKINSRIIHPGNNSPLKQPLWLTQDLELSHDQNTFSFAFAAIDYSNPSANKHLYKLENYDNDWRVANNEREASYFNVPPGKYILRIKASNSAGVWAVRDIAVTVYPPWWQTWWAYALFAIAFALLIWAFIVYRSRNLMREKRLLEQKVNVRTAEVLQQKEEIAAQRDNLEQTLKELQNAQAHLVQREKMASLGELTAGIAHEIQNPLNFVNNFSEVNKELITELKEELQTGNKDEAVAIANDLEQNLDKINHHGKRADAIVKGMLQHSRASSGKKELTDINALADEYLRLSYHGFRAHDKSFNADFKTNFDESIGKIEVVPQDIGRVLLNLYNNAFYAVNEKKRQLNGTFEPAVTVTTKRVGDKVEIVVKDNGYGIPQKVVDKIFQPFFTTKPTGQGTGLGLSLSYDIVKAHGGELEVESKEGEGAEFIVLIPYNSSAKQNVC